MKFKEITIERKKEKYSLLKGMVAKISKAFLGVENYQEALKAIWETDLLKEISTNIWKYIWGKKFLKSISGSIKYFVIN